MLGVIWKNRGGIMKGVIISIFHYPILPDRIWVKMESICKVRGRRCDWLVGAEMIELLPTKNKQLLFNFMGQV